MTIQVDIVTPERELFSGEVDMVTLPGSDGQMGIMAGHAPLLSTLDIGEIMLHRGNEIEYIAVGGGVVEVRPNKVNVLADVAEGEYRVTLNHDGFGGKRVSATVSNGDRRPARKTLLPSRP